MTKITVYPELKFIDRAWRVTDVWATKESLSGAGVPILPERHLPTGMVYGQIATLHDIESADVVKSQAKKIHDLVIAKAALEDVIAQKDIELKAKQFVCCGATCSSSINCQDLASLDDEFFKQIAKKLRAVCSAWESKHSSKMCSPEIARFADGKFDAMLTLVAVQDKNAALQTKISELMSKITFRNQVILALTIGFVVEQALRFVLR